MRTQQAYDPLHNYCKLCDELVPDGKTYHRKCLLPMILFLLLSVCIVIVGLIMMYDPPSWRNMFVGAFLALFGMILGAISSYWIYHIIFTKKPIGMQSSV